MMLKKFIFLALFISIFLVTTVKSNDDSGEDDDDAFDEHHGKSATEIVVDFLSKFATLSSTTADVGSFMDRISLSTFALPKLAFPVGSLIAGALNISTKTKSEEYRALMKLHDTMEVKFEEISRTIAVATKVIARESNLNEYINQVHVPARNLNQLIALFWNPAVDKSSNLVEAFKQNCYFNPQSQGTPLGILNYIYLNTVKYCHGLSRQQISLLAEFVPLLRQIRMQLSSDWAKEQFDELTPDLNIWFSDLGSNTAKTVLKKIEEGIDTSKTYHSAQAALSLVNSILKETEIEPQQNSMCLLQDIITGKNYHRKAIEEFEYIIRFDVLKMMVFGSICANITFGGDKPAMDWFQNQLLVTAKAIVDNVKSYILTELDNSFPEIETGVVKTIISEMGLKPPVTDNSTVTVALNTIFNELNEYGNRKFVRQGFVSTNLENETNFAMRCAPENCFSLLDVTGLHVMVTRFNTDIDEVRAIKSYEWLYNVGPKGFSNASFVWGFINTNYNVDKVSVLMSNLENKMFKLTNDDLYRSVAILRGSGRQCGVNAVSRALKIEEYAAFGSVYYHFVGSFWHDCENYFFYFYT